MIELFQASRTRAHDLIGAQFTAAALAHGAALVTLGGIIGNVDDPNFALRALKYALLLFTFGLATALAAIQSHALATAHQLSLELAEHRLAKAVVDSAIPPVDVFAPVDLSGARLVFGDKTEDEYRKFLVGRIRANQVAAEQVQKNVAESTAEIEKQSAIILKERVVAGRWYGTSIVLAGAACTAIWFAGAAGIQPQADKAPAPQDSPTVAQPTAQPAPPAPSTHPGTAGTPSPATSHPAPARPPRTSSPG